MHLNLILILGSWFLALGSWLLLLVPDTRYSSFNISST